MPLTPKLPNAAGVLGLDELPFPPGYAKGTGGAPILPADEKALVEVWGSLSAFSARIGTPYGVFQPWTLMVAGDSVAAGSGVSPAAPGLLRELQRQLRARRGDFRTIGTQVALAGGTPTQHGLFVGASYTAFPGDSWPGDWEHEGHPGETIQAFEAAYAGRIAQTGVPNFGLLEIGTNNLADGAPVMLQRMASLLATMARVTPSTLWFVCDIPRNSGSLATADAFNAGLPGVVGAAAVAGGSFVFVDAFADLSTVGAGATDIVNAADLAGVGVEHPTQTGYAIAAHRIDCATGPFLPVSRGVPYPRPFRPRATSTALESAILLAANGDGALAASNPHFDIGAASFVTSIDFRPTSTPAGLRELCGTGTASTTEGFSIYADGDALEVYLASGAPVLPAIGGCLQVNCWHRVALLGDRDAGAAVLFVNGVIRGIATGLAPWNVAAGFNVSVGSKFANSVLGYVGNWDMSKGPRVPTYGGKRYARAFAEADYFESAPWPTRVGGYSCLEGAGGTAADTFAGGTPLTLGGGAAWGTVTRPGTAYPPGFAP